eukprot:CAMPEP_0181491586 /NCGR_PEP_ID=MMETSP1110-20121109/50217_1 /TAXON_ID=174948 /ORGANISM="Symbiodinium sp., Strain CCMP421" /LENGTH=211 /DNA_ID=CAMNT_0023618741 /DNA_START=175 /DNA_END=805 /DNA_ORIENTATION=-
MGEESRAGSSQLFPEWDRLKATISDFPVRDFSTAITKPRTADSAPWEAWGKRCSTLQSRFSRRAKTQTLPSSSAAMMRDCEVLSVTACCTPMAGYLKHAKVRAIPPVEVHQAPPAASHPNYAAKVRVDASDRAALAVPLVQGAVPGEHGDPTDRVPGEEVLHALHGCHDEGRQLNAGVAGVVRLKRHSGRQVELHGDVAGRAQVAGDLLLL